MQTKVFTGELFEQKVTRKITTKDPETGRDISKLAKYDMCTGLVVDRVSGIGLSERTNEMQVTLSGQYKPFGTLRVTASSQNYDKVVEFLKGKVNKDEQRTLKDEITLIAIGTLMKGHGMNLVELYTQKPDGTKGDTIIPALPQSTETAGVDQSFF